MAGGDPDTNGAEDAETHEGHASNDTASPVERGRQADRLLTLAEPVELFRTPEGDVGIRGEASAPDGRAAHGNCRRPAARRPLPRLGIATPRTELQMIARRLRQVREEHERWVRSAKTGSR